MSDGHAPTYRFRARTNPELDRRLARSKCQRDLEAIGFSQSDAREEVERRVRYGLSLFVEIDR